MNFWFLCGVVWVISQQKTISQNKLLGKLMERDMTQRQYYHYFSFFEVSAWKMHPGFPHIVEFHVLFNHQGKQREAVFTGRSCLQSALNFLRPAEEMVFCGNATFDADGRPSYSTVPGHPQQGGGLESIRFARRTAIAQTSHPPLTFCTRLMSSEVSGMSRGHRIRGYVLRVSFKANSNVISSPTGSSTKGWQDTWCPLRAL